MQRKLLLLFVLLCLSGIIVFSVIFLCRGGKTQNNAYKGIPADAAMVVEVKSIEIASDLFSEKQKLQNSLSELPFLKKGCDFVVKIGEAVKQNEQLYTSFAECGLFYVVKKIGQNKLDFLYLMPLQNEQSADEVRTFVETAFSVANPSSSDYKDVKIYSYKDDASDRKNLTYSVCENTLIISESKVAVENSLKGFYEKNSNCLEQDPDFQRVRPNESKVPARVYFHYDRMASIFQLYASDEYVTRVKSYPKIASWTVLDLNLDSDAKSVRLNGYITLDSISCKSEYLNLFRNQQAVRGDIFSVLPASTSNFVAVCLSNKEAYKENYEEYLRKNSFFNAYMNDMKDLDEAFVHGNSRVLTTFYSWLDCEMAYVQIPSFSGSWSENTFCLIKTYSRKKTESDLLDMLGNYAEKNQTENVTVEKKIGSNEYSIYKMPVGKIPHKIWGNLFSHTSARYVFFIDSYMVFGNSVEACMAYISEYEKGNTLNSDPDYGRFDDNVKRSYSLYAYSSIPQSIPMFKSLFDEKTVKLLEEHSPELKDMNAFSYQLIADNGNKLYNDIFISYQSNKREKPETMWREFLDTIVYSQPKIFISHNGECLTLVQDLKNNLYLIDNDKDKILWKRELDGPIYNTIHLIDIYKNNKIQYLFNTANTMYCIDKNGDAVSNFPVKLESPATAAISVFDYDKIKKYRIAVPLENLSIELFSLDGICTKIPTWNVMAENPVKTSLMHFADAGKDYIVYADQYHVRILNRRGESRINVDEIIEKAPNSRIEFEVGAESSLTRFITTDVDGIVKEIYLDGSVVSSDKFGKRSAQHYFMTSDIDNDGNVDYVFVDENKVEVYSQDAKKLLSYSAKATLSDPFVRTLKNGEKKIGAVDKQDGKIYVINSDGALCKGFPIDGVTPFDISDESMEKGFMLIVGNEQNLLYNYIVK
ncbi:MAG: DUF3352 domain-containing protein [Bacteroidales bacterium]|nr:DUF3352 domain-containing protein [Bacteroidales bacterium]